MGLQTNTSTAENLTAWRSIRSEQPRNKGYYWITRISLEGIRQSFSAFWNGVYFQENRRYGNEIQGVTHWIPHWMPSQADQNVE